MRRAAAIRGGNLGGMIGQLIMRIWELEDELAGRPSQAPRRKTRTGDDSLRSVVLKALSGATRPLFYSDIMLVIDGRWTGAHLSVVLYEMTVSGEIARTGARGRYTYQVARIT